MSKKIKQNTKALATIDEVNTAIILIKKGLIEIRNMKSIKSPAYKHIPLLLLSNGFERLLKCLLIFLYYKLNFIFPRYMENFFKEYNNGHGLDLMFEEVLRTAKDSLIKMSPPLKRKEIQFLESDKNVKDLFKILSLYANSSSNYDVDVVISEDHPPKNLSEEFEKFREDLYMQLNYPINEFLSHTDKLNKHTIYIIARITKALCLCYTHPDFGYIASMHSSEVSDFTSIRTDKDYKKMNYLKI